MNVLLLTLCFIVAVASDVFAAQNGQIGRIAIFPFENFSEDKDALTYVMPALKSKLEAKGFDFLDADGLNKFLLKERIRSTGYISKEIARKLEEELNVEAVLIGSINTFSNGENSHIGLSARLVRCSDCSIIWADHEAATGEDFITVLGIGKITTIDELIEKVIDKLIDSFDLTHPYREIESIYRIAVMPFHNKTKIRNIGMMVTHMFIAELFKNERFIPLEFGEVRQLIVDLRFRERGEINFKNTEAISNFSGVDGIIVGTVEVYKEGLESVSPPEASISARLIDARKNRILWSDFDHYKGDDDIIILDWGRIRSVENVVYKVVSRLVKEMVKAKWH